MGIDAGTGKDLVRVDTRYFRPTEVEELIGDASKAAERLGWRHTTSFKDLVAEMVQSDLKTVPHESGRKDPGHY
jgi:GDPmannose 4,6-dehydratase